MSKKYASKFGFDKIQDWTICNFRVHTKDVDMDRLNSNSAAKNLEIICPQQEEKEVPWDKVFEYDRHFQGGVRRDEYVKCLLTLRDNSVTKVNCIEYLCLGYWNCLKCRNF